MDKILNDKIGAFLEIVNPTEDDVRSASLLLLQVYPKRYRALYNTINSRGNILRFADKVKYELSKHYTYLKDEKTREDVVADEKRVIGEMTKFFGEDKPVESTGELHRGKRSDHDSLPEDIKAIWEENANRYKAMKKLFHTLKGMENAEPCDRYETVKQLKDGYDTYRKRMQEYDTYVPKRVEETAETANELAKKVASARAYISKNKDKVLALKADESQAAAYAKKLTALKERVNILIEANAEFDRSILELFT